MKQFITTVVVALLTLSGAGFASGGDDPNIVEETKMVIKLITDDFELAETDISDLEIGDLETIVTDSGRVIDLLRTEDTVEVYVDGELLDIGLHSDHHVAVHKNVEVICGQEGEYEEWVVVSDGEECSFDLDALHSEGHGAVIIHGDDVDLDFEDFDGEHETKVIVIRKEYSEN